MTQRSSIEDSRFPVDPDKLRQELGPLTTEPFRAAVMHCTPSGREGVFASILHLREVSSDNALVVDRVRRAARDVRFADLIGQLNIVGLHLSYEDTSIRQVVEADPERWQDDRSRRGKHPSVRTLLQVFFATPEEYVDSTGRFARDLQAKSLEFRYGRLGGFVFDQFGTAGDQGHRKPGARSRRWRDELRSHDR